MATFSNLAARQYVRLTEMGPYRERLLALGQAWQLRGTVLLSPEGINLFVTAAQEKIEALLAELRSWPGLANLEAKVSAGRHQPFHKLIVRLSREMLDLKLEGIEPGQRMSAKLPPAKLKEWLDAGRPVALLDLRNDDDVGLGTFRSARPIGIREWRDFPAAVRNLPGELKAGSLVLFCTKGQRSEMAGPFLQHQGFQNVFVLEGGLFNYFAECGRAHFDGHCAALAGSTGTPEYVEDARLCFACLSPLSAAEQDDPRHVPGRSCPRCFQSAAEEMVANIAHRHRLIHRAVTPLPGREPRDNFKPVNIPAGCDGGTLLEALCHLVNHLPASHWELECSRGRLLNAKHERVGADHRVRAGEHYEHKFPAVTEPDVDGRVEILHEDEALVVLNKPAPLPMHAGGRFYRNTLQTILNIAYHPQKPRPAHRLDANTTGLVLVARTPLSAGRLQTQFARGQVRKLYLVRVQGWPNEEAFSCDAPISSVSGELGSRAVDFESGRAARTEFRVIERFADQTTLLEARPLTGRTHQIRVHLWHLGLPVCGDPVYLAGGAMGATQTLRLEDPPLCLHAGRIAFRHPLSREPVEFTAPRPAWANRPGTSAETR